MAEIGTGVPSQIEPPPPRHLVLWRLGTSPAHRRLTPRLPFESPRDAWCPIGSAATMARTRAQEPRVSWQTARRRTWNRHSGPPRTPNNTFQVGWNSGTSGPRLSHMASSRPLSCDAGEYRYSGPPTLVLAIVRQRTRPEHVDDRK